jgi:hypothetical protein
MYEILLSSGGIVLLTWLFFRERAMKQMKKEEM